MITKFGRFAALALAVAILPGCASQPPTDPDELVEYEQTNDPYVKGHSEDFGQTLAVWGVSEGPYIMLPLLGPTSPRDGVGMGVDMVADPIGWYAPTWANITRTVVAGVGTREQYLDVLDEVERSSLDYYASIRSMYRQNRAKEIKNQ